MLINDASITGSLIVNASASLQNISLGGNIIPDETNLRNLGSTAKYFKEIYVSTGSINFVDGGSVVAVLSAGTITAIQSNTSSANSRLTALESFTSSLNNTYTTDAELNASSSTLIANIDTKLNSSSFNSFTSSATARVNSIETITSSNIARLNSIETITSSNIARLNSIETITSSNVARLNAVETITASNVSRLNSIETITSSNIARLNSLEIKTGSLATTGSNTFIGTQTITGSLFISSNLVVQGTSSLQNITASAVSIGTNLINLNTANPAIRYAGLVIGDSGSVGGSGSFLYDSVQDEMIFVHRGTSTVVTSSVTLMGPQTYDNLGTETYPTLNIIQKGTGNEHLSDSCIFDNGTTVCVNTTLKASGQVCGVMGNFSCVGIGTSSPSTTFEVSSTDLNNIFVTNPTTTGTTTGSGIGFKAYNGTSVAQAAGIILTSNTWSYGTYSANQLSVGSDGTGGIALRTACSAPITFFTGCTTAGLSAERMRITSTGVVGIGTSSPAGRLEVWQCTNNRLVIDCANVQNEPRISSLDSAGNPQYLTINSYDLKIKSNGSEALRITDKKHLLVGTQSDLTFYSAWDSGVTRIGTSGVLFSYLNNSDNFIISQNYYVNAAGSDVRISSGPAANIYFASGDILFRTVGTGAAESATSWNTPLRLTCTGASLISGCSTFYCTTEFSKMQKSTNGNWYKIPFMVEKGTATGSARTVCIVDINNMGSFNEFIVHIDYGARLQGVSDSVTNISSRMYGINRFNDGAVAINESYIPVGGSGNINTHAPVTAAVVASNRLVVKVDFSATPSYSSMVWGEIRIFSIENLNGNLSIPGNQW